MDFNGHFVDLGLFWVVFNRLSCCYVVSRLQKDVKRLVDPEENLNLEVVKSPCLFYEAKQLTTI